MAATVLQLEYKHPEYLRLCGVWDIIADIREGASTFKAKARKYLLPRPGEDLDIYEHRLTKLSFTPVASNAIRELVSELTSAPRSLEVLNTSDKEFWSKFRDSTDGKGKDESELISHIASSILYFGSCYLAADNPIVETPINNLYQQESLDLRPYLTTFEPLDVTNWGEGWYQTRQILNITKPLEKPYKLIRWTFWLPDRTEVYEAKVHLDSIGALSQVQYGDAYLSFDNATEALQPVRVVKNNTGKSLMVHLTLPSEAWTGNNVYLKQLQHFLIESSWTDSGTLAGIIQRVYKPMPATVTDDPTQVVEEQAIPKIVNDNAHIMVGADFMFVESEGKAIASLTSQLNTIEQQIKQIVSQGFASVQNDKVVDQSGVAKQVDRATLEKTLQGYGAKIAQLYQDGLQRVALLAGKSPDIQFSGLNDYNSDNLSEALNQTMQMISILHLLPPTGLRLWFSKLGWLIAGTKSGVAEQDIVKEVLAAIPDNFRELVVTNFGQTPPLNEDQKPITKTTTKTKTATPVKK